MLNYAIRDYQDADEPSWLRCRVLSFLATAYFDDVHRRKPSVPAPGFGMVAVDPQHAVIGIIDVTVEADLATIDTLIVDDGLSPDQRQMLTQTDVRVIIAGAKEEQP